MIRHHLALFTLAALLASGLFFVNNWRAHAAAQLAPRSFATRPVDSPHGQRSSNRQAPGPAIDPYVRPEFASEMRALRPTILAAARRHNRRELSGMNDDEFAVVIALLMYNEHFGWFEEKVPPVQRLTPLYESLQVSANETGVSDLSLWPSNLRPSVALEILRQQVPVPAPTSVITVPLAVFGSKVQVHSAASQSALYAAISREIAQPKMAVEYLAANIERGLYRAHFEGIPVTWRALAAWHNQGIVAPEDIRRNATASDYIHRSSAYMATARALIYPPPARPCSANLCRAQ